MDHAQGFLQDVREHPDDDTPRLVYADWLEEKGTPTDTARAAFIRTQCRLAPLALDDPERLELQEQADELLLRHEDEWVGPLRDLADDWQFERGFVERVRISGEAFLANADRLTAATPLRAVELRVDSKDLPELAGCPHLSHLEVLDLRRCRLPDAALLHLVRSPHLGRLRALDLDSNRIEGPFVQALAGSDLLPRLRRLDLTENFSVGDRAARLLAESPGSANLETLRIAHVNLTPDGLRAIFQSPHLGRLTALDAAAARETFWWQRQAPGWMRDVAASPVMDNLTSLDFTHLVAPDDLPLLVSRPRRARWSALYLRGGFGGAGGARILAESPQLASLTTLDLRANNLGPEGAKALAESPHLASLTVLNLFSNQLRDQGVRELAESPYLARLRVLDLGGQNQVGGPGLQALANSPNVAQLNWLGLAYNFVGRPGTEVLAGSRQLARLSVLDLGSTELGAACARILAESPYLSRLTRLVLDNNQLGDKGVRALAESANLSRLRVLLLSNNGIGRGGARALLDSPHLRRLRRLDLRHNNFTGPEQTRLREHFGNAVLL
jgi:uncharacterized protein (TIGR02996 family)